MDEITQLLNNGGVRAGTGIAVVGAVALALKYLRDIVREFKQGNFKKQQHADTYRAHMLFDKCYDAALVILKGKKDFEDIPDGEIDHVFKEIVEGCANDIFPQNGIDPRNYKFEYMISMETYKRYKKLKLPKEVI